jgi:hypothetical protein
MALGPQGKRHDERAEHSADQPPRKSVAATHGDASEDAGHRPGSQKGGQEECSGHHCFFTVRGSAREKERTSLGGASAAVGSAASEPPGPIRLLCSLFSFGCPRKGSTSCQRPQVKVYFTADPLRRPRGRPHRRRQEPTPTTNEDPESPEEILTTPLLVVLTFLLLLDVLVLLGGGHDSRDGRDWQPRGSPLARPVDWCAR